MNSFGERQAVSKQQKWFLEYKISFCSAIVFHIPTGIVLATQNMAEIYVDIQAMQRNKLTRSKEDFLFKPRKRLVQISSNSLL